MAAAVARDLALGIAAAVTAGAVSWSAYLAALLWLPAARVATRWCAAALLALWPAVALFWLLTPIHAFRLPVILGIAVLAAGLLHRAAGRRENLLDRLGRDARAARGLVASLGRGERWLAGAVLAVAALRALRSLASPPLGWDDLTYHLLRAGRWVQAGGFVGVPAPDAWGSYGYMPAGGEILWSWAMLLGHGDGLIAVASPLVWALSPLAVYAGARELGAGRRTAVLAAVAVAAMPALLAYVGTGYVDGVTAAAVGLGALFAARLLRGGGPREAPLAIAGLALAAGTKLLALPLLPLGAAALAWAFLRGADRPRRRLALAAACLLAAGVAVPSYARAWLEQGSPLYPFPVEVAGVTLSVGNSEAAEIGREVLADPASHYSPLDSAKFLLGRTAPLGAFVNPGPAALVVIALGAWALARSRGTELLASLFLAASAAVFLGAYLSSGMALFRTTYLVASSGRYLMPAFVALGMVAALPDGRIPRLLWAAVAGTGAFLALPVAWSSAGLAASGWAAAILSVAVAAAVLLRRSFPRVSRGVAAGMVLFLAGASFAGVQAVRRAYRYPIYAAAADPAEPAFQLHPLDSRYVSAWSLWQRLDGPSARTVAVTAGFESVGHNWYLYPLLGSRLQNRVLYVPVTRSGEVVDYRSGGEVRRRADRRCWLARLRTAGVDAVASLAPRTTVEEEWMREEPERFTPVLVTPDRLHALYEVDRDSLAAVSADGCEAPAVPGTGATS